MFPSFNEISPATRLQLKKEFEHPGTSDERRVQILQYVQAGAQEWADGRVTGPGHPRLMCINCKKAYFFAPWSEGLIEGHIYSDAGAREVHLSGMCEYCFDKLTAEPEEE